MTDIEMAHLIAEKVSEQGGTAYFVGGYVRDKLLGIDSKDIDIEIHNISVLALGRILDSLGNRIETGKSFGVYGLKGYHIDIAVPRRERPTGNGHTDFEVTADPFIGTYEAAKRRDFTINALMENVLTGEIVDHFNGQDDLKAKIIRHVNADTFVEDPLRVYRAAQFSARFGFEIAPETIELCRHIDTHYLSNERVFEELKKALLKSDKPSIFFTQLFKMNQLYDYFAYIEELIGIPQNPKYHGEGDVWNHTMLVLDEAAKRRDKVNYPLGFMLSALCHDLGKISCTKDVEGKIVAHNHETDGLVFIIAWLVPLSNEYKLIKYVSNMTELHMKVHKLADSKVKMKSANKILDQAIDPYDLIQLGVCDGLGRIPSIDTEKEFMERYKVFTEVMSKPYVMGRDLIEAGLEPGAYFMEVLEYAHKLRLAGVSKENQLKQAVSYARIMLRKQGVKRDN